MATSESYWHQLRGMTLQEKIEHFSMPEPNSGCWLWLGAVHSVTGYAKLRYKNVSILAHRASYLAFRGGIPAGLFVCHHCDVRSCVNPLHLYAGTHQQNMDDKQRRGRQCRGSGTVMTDLTESDVRDIRAASGTLTEIGRPYGLKKTTISAIRTRKTWKHI